jgi:hypothetical protein
MQEKICQNTYVRQHTTQWIEVHMPERICHNTTRHTGYDMVPRGSVGRQRCRHWKSSEHQGGLRCDKGSCGARVSRTPRKHEESLLAARHPGQGSPEIRGVRLRTLLLLSFSNTWWTIADSRHCAVKQQAKRVTENAGEDGPACCMAVLVSKEMENVFCRKCSASQRNGNTRKEKADFPRECWLG